MDRFYFVSSAHLHLEKSDWYTELPIFKLKALKCLVFNCCDALHVFAPQQKFAQHIVYGFE